MANFQAKALPDTINKQVPESKPPAVVEPDPDVVFNKWLERQERLHPLPRPKKPWFSIESEVDVEPIRPRIETIQAAVAKHYGVTRGDILSARRTADVVRPRQVGYYLSKALSLKSLPEIGRRFGMRDHTSALHGIRKIEQLRKTDAQLESDLHAIAAKVGGVLA